MVERHLAKVNVASSNLVFRSKRQRTQFASFVLKNLIRRHSQVVRQSSAKALSPGSNPGGASKKRFSFENLFNFALLLMHINLYSFLLSTLFLYINLFHDEYL